MTDSPVAYDPFRSGELERTVPSTEPQREIISSALLGDTANIAFNEGVSVHFPYRVDAARLNEALATIVARHESLRTTFTRSGDEICVAAEGAFELIVDDQSTLESEAAEAYVQSFWQRAAKAPMNLFDGPLFHATLIVLPGDRAELVIMAHHVICDGWSFYIILEELAALLSGQQPAHAPDSFADFAERQHAEQLSNQDIDYWLAQYASSVPELDLPTDRPRPAERSFAARRTDYVLDSDATASIKALAREYKASIVQVTFAGVAALLHRLTADEDIAIGLPVARQSTDGLSYMLGHAVQLLPIRLATSADETFRELVAKSKSGILDAQEHPNFTFGSLVREVGQSGDASRVPIVPVIFNIDQPFGELRAEGHALTVRSVPRYGENFEIFFNVMPTGDELRIEATYNTDLFDEGTIVDWLDALRLILSATAGDPDIALRDLWRDAGASNRVAALRGRDAQLAAETWIAPFRSHAQASGETIAVMDGATAYSRAEVIGKANAVASALVAAGVTPGDVVAHCMGRGADLPVVMLGIQLAGAIMLPLDPEFPADRLAFMLEDSGAKLVVGGAGIPERFAALPVTWLSAPEILADTGQCALPELTARSPAYLIYTSGSTGKPKGVLVSHGALVNFLQSMAETPGFEATDRLLAVTTASFDISLLELLLPLYCGGAVYVATKAEATDARALRALIEQQDISVLQATPATWRLLLAAQWQGAPGIKALCGGEAMPVDLARRLLPLVGELWNMYGPTETTIWSSCKRVEAGFETITIGTPIANTSFVVIDGARNAVPSSVPGELCIGGAGLAIEYLGRESLTAERFIESQELGRLYRTGDRARILANGELQFLGRFDDQVKVRGYRIELGDIEAALQEFPGIDAVAAYVWDLGASDQRIVACCVASSGEPLPAHRLRKFLRERLPDYMIPQHFLEIEALPLSPSGKVTRRALPRPVEVQSKIGVHSPPQNSAEKAIAEIWTTLVKPERPIGREARFFEIGGHSLLGLEAIFRIEQRLNVRLHPRILFVEDLAGIARQCDSGAAAEAASRPTRLADDIAPLLSFGQLEIAERLDHDPDDTTFNLPACFKLTGRLDVDRLRASLNALFDRHAALTTLLVEGADEPRPALAGASGAPELEVVSDFPGAEAEAIDYTAMLAREPVNLATGPLARIALLSSPAQTHYLCFVPHQFAFDGWSFDVFLRELETAYVGGGKLPETDRETLRYTDFSTWQRSQPVDDGTAAYWGSQLPQLAELPPWHATADASGSAVAAAGFSLPLATVQKLEAELAKTQSKLADVALAVLVAALGASARAPSVSLDLATSGRYLPELSSIIVLFYQDLPVTIPVGATVRETLANTEAAVRALAQHQDVARARLEAQLGERLLRPAVSYSYQQATERPTHFGDLAFAQVDVPRTSISRDLDFWIRRTPVGLVAQFDYRADRIDGAAVERLSTSMREALESLARGDSGINVAPIDGLFDAAPARRAGLLSKLFSK